MSAADSTSKIQFEEMTFKGVPIVPKGGHYRDKSTFKGQVPKLETPDTHRRIWRSTSQESDNGLWSDRPMPGYGNRMLYADVPHDVAEQLPRGEGNSERDEQSRVYKITPESRPEGFKSTQVKYYDGKRY